MLQYKAVVVDDSPKAKPLAAAVEAKSNEMAAQGYKLVTMSITGSSKAILVFKTDAPAAEAQETDTEPAK